MESAKIAMRSVHALQLHTTVSEMYHQEQGSQEEFSKSEKGVRLRQQFRALETDQRLYTRQAELLSTETHHKDSGKFVRHAFLELFTTSKIGLGITSTGRGRRETSVQNAFRAQCIKEYSSRHPDPNKEFLWCPIIKSWAEQDYTTATHPFAYMHGQDVMDSVFGPMPTPELFSPSNGMIISQSVEKRFDSGFMAIVPRLPNHPTPEQMSLWHSSKPKEYKVRILDLEDPEASKVIRPGSEQKWKDLDGTNVEFQSTFRPRARYLYFHYCMQILRRAWKAEKKASEQLKKEFGKGYWGTVGGYLPHSMLRAFVDELGHEYEALMAGAKDDKATASEEDKILLLAVVSSQVKASRGPEEGDEDSEDDETDDDEDDGLFR
jgi:HNH endonuclease